MAEGGFAVEKPQSGYSRGPIERYSCCAPSPEMIGGVVHYGISNHVIR
jgi:hypothetical protein